MFDDAGNLMGNRFSRSSDMQRPFDSNRVIQDSLPGGSRGSPQNRFYRSNMGVDESDRTARWSDRGWDGRPYESSREAQGRNLSSSRLNANNGFDMNRERFNDRRAASLAVATLRRRRPKALWCATGVIHWIAEGARVSGERLRTPNCGTPTAG